MKMKTITKTTTGALDVVSEDGRKFRIEPDDELFQAFVAFHMMGGADGVRAIHDDAAGIPQWARKRASR